MKDDGKGDVEVRESAIGGANGASAKLGDCQMPNKIMLVTIVRFGVN